MRTLLPWLVGGIALLFGVAAQADIYTWVDADGVRHYSDSADGSGAQRADLPGIQSMQGDPDALARLREAAQANRSKRAVTSRTVDIVKPQPDETFRDPRGLVPIAVTIGGAGDLRAGEQITYYLDGSPIPQSPTELTSLQLGNVQRGEHTLSAALMFQGKEVRRSDPVTFYMKPPSAISPMTRGSGDGDGDGDGQPETGAGTAPAAGQTQGMPAAPRMDSGSSGTAAGPG